MRSVAGEDYTTTSVIVIFQATETSQTVMVPILGDNTLEGVEQFTVRLFLPADQRGVVLGSDTATVEITHSTAPCIKTFQLLLGEVNDCTDWRVSNNYCKY